MDNINIKEMPSPCNVPFLLLMTGIDGNSFPTLMNIRTETKEEEDNDLRSKGLAVDLAMEFCREVAKDAAVRQDRSCHLR